MTSEKVGKKRSFQNLQNSEEYDNKVFGNARSRFSKKSKLNDTTPQIAEPNEDEDRAWVDSDDENLRVDVKNVSKLRHLRAHFEEREITGKELTQRQRQKYDNINTANDWTKLRDDVDKNDSDKEKKDEPKPLEMFETSGKFVVFDKETIPADKLSFTVLGDVNGKTPHQSIVTVLEFHPNGQLLMTAGLDKTMQLFQLTGHRNVLLKRLFLSTLPIRTAHFTTDGKEIIIGGRRPYFFVFTLSDFACTKIHLIGRDEKSLELFWVSPDNQYLIFLGNRGQLIVVSRKTKRPIKTLHVSDGISDCKFNKNGSRMYCISVANKMFTFDMTSFSCINLMTCDGVVGGTSLNVMPELNLFAIGCSSGVVSIFQKEFVNNKNGEVVIMSNADTTETTKGVTKPLYSINNLTTTINGVQFNHDGQLLAIWSKNKKLGARLIHVSTGRAYQNWPTNLRIGHISACAFSPNSGYLAVGNASGYVQLIRLHFYGDV